MHSVLGEQPAVSITAGLLPRLRRRYVWYLACAWHLVDAEKLVALILLEKNETSGDVSKFPP